MLNFNHLYYFYVVVKEGSISSAARRLRVSQPALSTQIKHLEASMERQLFTRRGRKIEITEDGRQIYRYACQMFELAETMLQELRAPAAQPEPNRLQLGVADDIERPFSVRLVTLLLNRKSQQTAPTVTLTCDSHEGLIEKLGAGLVDAILSDRPIDSASVEVLGTARMPVMLAVAPHKLRGLGPLSHEISASSRVLESGLILPSPKFRLRREIDAFLAERGLTPHLVLESDLLATVVRAVLDGVGASFLPLPYISEGVARHDLTLFGPHQGYWQHALWLVGAKDSVRTNSLLTDLKRAFQDLSREMEELKLAA